MLIMAGISNETTNAFYQFMQYNVKTSQYFSDKN